jgi:hypothetical protein
LPAPSASAPSASVASSAVQVETVHTSLRFFSVHVPTPTPPHSLATSARGEIVKWQAQWQHVSPEVRQSVGGSERVLLRSRLPAGLARARWRVGSVGGNVGRKRQQGGVVNSSGCVGLMGVDVCVSG